MEYANDDGDSAAVRVSTVKAAVVKSTLVVNELLCDNEET
jgi:hypothetical protein